MDLAIPLGPSDHVRGRFDAPVEVVQYGDFDCPVCRQAARTLPLLVLSWGDAVAFAFRHFPMTHAHPGAALASAPAEAAGRQGAFWPMHDALLDGAHPTTRRRVVACADEIGLDVPRLLHDLDDPALEHRVLEHRRSGELSRVRSTPAFFVDGRLQDVSFGFERLFAAVRAKARRAGAIDPCEAARFA